MVYNHLMTLKELRRLRKLTETEMAERMGLSRPGVQKVERGAPTTTTTLMAYAQALGLDFVTIAGAWQKSQNNAYLQ